MATISPVNGRAYTLTDTSNVLDLTAFKIPLSIQVISVTSSGASSRAVAVSTVNGSFVTLTADSTSDASLLFGIQCPVNYAQVTNTAGDTVIVLM